MAAMFNSLPIFYLQKVSNHGSSTPAVRLTKELVVSMRKIAFCNLIALSIGVGYCPSHAAPVPLDVGQCSNSFVKEVTARFGARLSEFGSEDSLLDLTSGISLYLYRKLRTQSTPGWGITSESSPVNLADASSMFRPNDKVKICLEFIPVDCDTRMRLGDRRGEIYYVSNYSNSVSVFGHLGRNSCGGA